MKTYIQTGFPPSAREEYFGMFHKDGHYLEKLMITGKVAERRSVGRNTPTLKHLRDTINHLFVDSGTTYCLEPK